VVIVGHGRSSARAVENAVLLAQRFVDAGVLARFERGIAAIPVSAS
jgi:fatty acid/phospholipid biosynthesis enzyme